MLYACVGAHRSGKTTTAKLVAEQLGIEFIDSSFSVAREFGYNPVAPMSIKTRLEMQRLVLNHHVKVVSEAPRPAITDRTPLDMAAYMMAEIHMMSHMTADEETLAAVREYCNDCLTLTRGLYDMVFLLDPLPVYVEDDSKATPAANPAFQLHIDTLLHGSMSKLHNRLNWAFVPVMSIEERAGVIVELVVERMDEIEKMKQAVGFH